MAVHTPLSTPEVHNAYSLGDSDVELAVLPKSRASSYAPSTPSLFRTDLSEQGDDAQLLLDGSSRWSSKRPKDNEIVVVRELSRTATRALRASRRRLEGWRVGVLMAAWTTSIVLIVNLILLIAAGASYEMDDGIGTIMNGNCRKVNTAATWLHVFINGLGSVLLSASNYTMQCIAAPTRAELDRAHAKGKWMDVGISSIRNLFSISWQRVAIWWILALSTLPIHMLFNSAVFKTIDANQYMIIVANTGFFERGADANFTTTVFPDPGTMLHNPNAFNYSMDPAVLGAPNSSNYSIGTSFSEDGFPNIRYTQNLFARNSAYLNTSAFQNLTNEECIAAYGHNYVSGRDDVIAITNERGDSDNNTLFYYTFTQLTGGFYGPSYDWLCTDDVQSNYYAYNCAPAEKRKTANEWTLAGKKIEYCLSHLQPPHCKLQFSAQILAAVVMCNALKSAAMFYTLYKTTTTTLVTVGDAVASYLDEPDELTIGRCLMAKRDAGRRPMRQERKKQPVLDPTATLIYMSLVPAHVWTCVRWISAYASRICSSYVNKSRVNPPTGTYYVSSRRRWFAACSATRWSLTVLLCTLTLAVSSFLLVLGVLGLLGSGVNFMTLPFGGIDSRALLVLGLPSTGPSGLLSQVLLSNLPQAVLSLLYLMYNGLYTCMCLCHEWSVYAIERQPLRVTTPRGQQRSTYYLQLPYWYGVPLIAASGILHWLVSQSLFLARISIWVHGQSDGSDDISATGYSCTAVLSVIVLGTIMLLVAIGMGFRKFPSSMPVAGSCSVAIAAACHRPKDDTHASVRDVMWGEVTAEGTDEVGHCSFTSGPVTEPIPGRAYAGSEGITTHVECQGTRRRKRPM